MKLKNLFTAIAVAALPLSGALTSCSDMLESESSLFVSDPNLNQKSDSVFYAYGIMQAMQQLADQYYFQNEMRGEISVPTAKATTHLKNLANYSADAECKYDSVYLYYKVINNCNTYLQKRDTTLMSGTTNVTINEYVAIAAFRAWTYLQLTKQYGDVPYLTTPVLTVSEINAKTEHTPYRTILADQAQYLQNLKNSYSYEFLRVPYYQASVSIGHMNFSNASIKYMTPSKCFFPINIVLGDLYLELGEYEKAAECYHDYLLTTSKEKGITGIRNNYCNMRYPHDADYMELPMNYYAAENTDIRTTNQWDNIFHTGAEPGDEVISYIPMAVNYTMGQTTDVPYAFGYDYYATSYNQISKARLLLFRCPEHNEPQIQPSADYMNMVKNAPFYYVTNEKDPLVLTTRYLTSSTNVGDGRANMIVKGEGNDSTKLYVQKPSTGFFYIYRNSTVYLRLAESLNRMGEPELAFAVLKSGINSELKQYVDTAYVEDYKIPQENYYIPKASYDRICTGKLDFLSSANVSYFTNANKEIVGIHQHGAGMVAGKDGLRSQYNYATIVGARIDKIRSQFAPEKIGEPYTKEEYINAVEDLICEEYALEFAFEGTRFSDLVRIARHKNLDSPYGGQFGSTWFADIMKGNNPVKSLTDENNWYLPFK